MSCQCTVPVQSATVRRFVRQTQENCGSARSAHRIGRTLSSRASARGLRIFEALLWTDMSIVIAATILETFSCAPPPALPPSTRRKDGSRRTDSTQPRPDPTRSIRRCRCSPGRTWSSGSRNYTQPLPAWYFTNSTVAYQQDVDPCVQRRGRKRCKTRRYKRCTKPVLQAPSSTRTETAAA